MANVSIREAVKLYSVSRPTLTKHLKNGEITGVQDGKGHWKIDTSELARRYDARSTEAVNEQAKLTTSNTPEIEDLRIALVKAEARAEAAEQLAQERADRIEDLRRLLPAPSEPRKRPGWWPWKG